MAHSRTRPLPTPLPRRLPRAGWLPARRPRLNARQDWPLTLWRLIWAPWWLGSEMPPPPLPRQTHEVAPPRDGPGGYVALRLDQLARRYHAGWVLMLLVRGLWLGLMVSAVWMVLGAFAGFATLGMPGIGAVVALSVAGAGLGLLLGRFARPDRRRIARMLDRSFDLDERMTTAVELLASSDRGRLDTVQLADAGNQLAVLRLPGRLVTLFPVRELVLLLLWTMVLLALAFAGLNARGIPDPSQAAIPAYVPAGLRLAAPNESQPISGEMPTSAEIQERSRRSNEARRDLDRLGDALAEHPSTLAAADAIAAGDYSQAAASLRTAAAESDQLSPEARAALADDLDAAAADMSEGSPELAQASRDAAAGLRTGEDGAAETGLSGLADEVEQTGEEVVPQQELAEQQAGADGAASGQQAGATSSHGDQSEGTGQQSGEASTQSESGADQEQAQDPGSGADARGGASQQQPGNDAAGGEQPQQASQAGSAGGENQEGGQGGTGGNEDAGEASQEGGTGASDQAGQPRESGGQSGAEASGGEQDASDSTESNQTAQGSGAGSGDSAPGDPTGNEQSQPGDQQRQPGDPTAEAASAGRAAETPPAKVGADNAQPTAVAGAGDQAVSLSGDSDEGVQTGGSAGSASLGSGGGAGAGGGDVVQGAVGSAGPDSNRVPVEYRDVVSSYFSEEEQP